MQDSQHAVEFVQLLTSHQRRLHRYISVFLPRAADAEDVLQETNTVLWAKSGQFVSGTSFLAWARAIARFEIVEYSRRNQRVGLVLDSELVETLSTDIVDSSTDDYREAAMRSCVEKLSAVDRKLVADRYDADASVTEVAQRQNRTPGSVYRSLERIRMMLLECIQRTLAAEDRGV